MTLRQQLIGTIAIVLLATLLLGALLVHWHAVRKVETEMSAAIEVGARIARNAVDDADEVINPRRRLELLVADFDGDRHLRAIALGPDGTAIRSSRPAANKSPAPRWLERWLETPPRRSEVALPAVFKPHGSLVLETDARNEIAEVWEDLLVYAKLLGVYSISGLGVTLLVLAHAMRPLRDLSIAITRIGAGDFSARLAETGPAELVKLASGFNDMTDRLGRAESRNTQLVDQLSRVQAEERAELSRNLHDEVSPLLFSVDVDATSIRQLAREGRAEEIEDKSRSIQTAVQSMKSNVRGIIEQLRPVHVEAADWRSAIGELVEFWQRRFPHVLFDLRLEESGFPGDIAGTLKHLTSESISNALKHGSPRRIAISVVTEEGAVVATIRDDGGGLRKSNAASGYGLVGMGERIERAGGTLDVATIAEPPGVEVRARFPHRPGAVAVEPQSCETEA